MRAAPGLVALLFAFATAAGAADERRQDEHSYAEPDKVRITQLGLDLRVDFEKKQLRGSADLALEWLDPDHRQLVLDTRDLGIERVLGKRQGTGWYSLDYSVGERDPLLGSPLTIRMTRQYDVVRVRYATAPEASGLQWLEPGMTAGKQHPFLFSQAQAIHARSFVPLQDTPSVRFTYTAHVETPPELMALMSADNDPKAPRDGDYVFRMQQPIPSYLMAIAVGDLVFRPISERVGVWAEPATVKAAVAEFADTEQMVQVTEDLYGPYRWERYDLLILPPSFPYGGMENPRLSFITPTVIVGDKSLTSLIAHELAHSWSGNLVTNATSKDFWLNEGFTSYVESRIVEAVYGKDQADMENVIGQFGLRQDMATMDPRWQRLVLPPMEGEDPDEATSQVAYVKGAWFLSFLEKRFGRETFDAFLRQYFDHFAFQSITSQDFVAYLREHLLPKKPGAVTEEELNAWLYEPGIPAFAEAATSARFDAVDQARQRWLDQDVAARELATDQWSTQEWVRFLEGMPDTLPPERLVELDQAFSFTGTPNGEIAQRWYPLTVRSNYFEARPAIAAFLKTIGRRKLIMPTYEELAKSPDGLEFARDVFEDARPGYHPITTVSVERTLATPTVAD